MGYGLNIDGTRDWIDFFVVDIDIHDVLEVYPNDDYKYILKHPELNYFDYPGLTPQQANYHLKNLDFCIDNKDEILHNLSGNGKELSSDFIDAVLDDEQSLLLFEVCGSSTAPLILEIRSRDGDHLVHETRLSTSFSSVTDMYRILDLHCVTEDNNTNINYVLPESSNRPDEECNGKHFVYVHGYSAALEDKGPMAGWLSEVFKRTYWSGDNAIMHSFSWQSDQGDPSDYGINVDNAFKVAPYVAEYISRLDGDVTVAAHSLGNVVVSEAIVNHGLRPDNYFLIDAAVVSEAYDATATQTEYLENPLWSEYTNRASWATEWHTLFDSSDTRSELTWRGRFAEVVNYCDNVVNFYSSGDEVFEFSTTPGSAFDGVMSLKLTRILWIIPIPMLTVDFAR